MKSRIEPGRIRPLGSATTRAGDYVLYWMQASHRVEDNPALAYAVERADAAGLPLVACFGLDAAYPEANLRHFRFMLEGLADVAAALESLGIRFVLRNEPPDQLAVALAKDAAAVVVDRGYLRHQESLYASLAARCRCPLLQVEANVVVPVETASAREEYSAATFRRKVTPLLDRFLHTAEVRMPARPSLSLDIPTLAGERIDGVLARLFLDRSVPASPVIRGGTAEAGRRFERFLEMRLDRFGDGRNDPGGDGGSGMSPYLHFGQVSPVSLALRAGEHGGDGVAAFLEELVVRRELSVNFVRYNARYDAFASLPAWAQKTLTAHAHDKREYTYTRDELDRAVTHDRYWNAAQKEMVATGRMQGYMRMYWGKKILEWSETPQDAYAAALYLNNRYEIDGRDPNAYAGVAWCFGKHDRPFSERPVFGIVRPMTAGGLERKFAMGRYLAKVAGLGTARDLQE